MAAPIPAAGRSRARRRLNFTESFEFDLDIKFSLLTDLLSEAELGNQLHFTRSNTDPRDLPLVSRTDLPVGQRERWVIQEITGTRAEVEPEPFCESKGLDERCVYRSQAGSVDGVPSHVPETPRSGRGERVYVEPRIDVLSSRDCSGISNNVGIPHHVGGLGVAVVRRHVRRERASRLSD